MTAPEQAEAAVRHARRNVATALGVPDEPSPRGVSALFEELWARHGDDPRCRHLDARPLQPWNLFPASRVWRCGPCQGTWSAQQRATRAAGLPILDAVEEFTCDRCRRYVPADPLQPTVIRQDFWVIVCALCRRCTRAAQSAGAKVVTP